MEVEGVEKSCATWKNGTLSVLDVQAHEAYWKNQSKVSNINQLQVLKSLPSLFFKPVVFLPYFFFIKYESDKLTCQYKYVILKEVFKILEEVEKMGF